MSPLLPWLLLRLPLLHPSPDTLARGVSGLWVHLGDIPPLVFGKLVVLGGDNSAADEGRAQNPLPGRLHHPLSASQPIDYEGFRLFMKTYLEADVPEELCQHLFTSFKRKICQASPETQRQSPGVPQLHARGEPALSLPPSQAPPGTAAPWAPSHTTPRGPRLWSGTHSDQHAAQLCPIRWTGCRGPCAALGRRGISWVTGSMR